MWATLPLMWRPPHHDEMLEVLGNKHLPWITRACTHGASGQEQAGRRDQQLLETFARCLDVFQQSSWKVALCDISLPSRSSWQKWLNGLKCGHVDFRWLTSGDWTHTGPFFQRGKDFVLFLFLTILPPIIPSSKWWRLRIRMNSYSPKAEDVFKAY